MGCCVVVCWDSLCHIHQMETLCVGGEACVVCSYSHMVSLCDSVVGVAGSSGDCK